jgi:hypothetical protein
VKITMTAAVALSLAVPTVAHADFSAEMRAAGKVEQKAISRYRGFNVTATCDQQSRTKFWCTFIGNKGCF